VSKCINADKLPAVLPDLPPVPAGWDAWEYMGREWDSGGPVGSPWGATIADSLDTTGWLRPSTNALFDPKERNHGLNRLHYIRAVKLPAKKQAQKKAKPIRRVSRIATVIQRAIIREFPTAMDAAREVERIIDNDQRKKRRKMRTK